MNRPCAVFVDAEPPSRTGGGIRSYLLQAAPLLRDAGFHVRLYSQSPGAFSGFDCRPIPRRPWPPRPFRGLLYRLAYAQAVAFEQSRGLAETLLAEHRDGTRYEFCDYDGLAFHALRHKALKANLSVRVHTPQHVILSSQAPSESAWTRRLLAWREGYCLDRAPRLSAPSPEFLAEKMPGLRQAQILYNPPPALSPLALEHREDPLRPEFLYLGRWEKRKGLLEVLRAFAAFQAQVPEARLTVIGEAGSGEYAGQVRAFIGKGRPWLTIEPAYQGPKADLFSRFGVLLIPSLWENAPYVFYEALANGVLALGSATGDMGTAQKRTHGLFPQGGSIDSWTQALLKLWQDRHLAAHWRGNQVAWLADRRKQACQALIDHWTHWPINT